MSPNKYRHTFHEFDLIVSVKNMKNIRLKKNPRDGLWQLSIPFGVSLKEINAFLESNYDWMKEIEKKMTQRAQKDKTKFENNSKHLLFGVYYTFSFAKAQKTFDYQIDEDKKTIHIYANHEPNPEINEQLLNHFYTLELQKILPDLIEKCTHITKQYFNQIKIKTMISRWGSCSLRTRNISLNSHLAKHPIIHIEHVLIHELTHFLEPSHNHRFKAFLDQFQPGWRTIDRDIKRIGFG
ncbi:MAG: M48 family metallopeptidase [Flavobacteriales bacterium]|jgi:predicted metal-dependent hydrolase|nr:M48 family metallopeptidase [Flavobacteriales bacterium]